MASDTKVKICGLTQPAHVTDAVSSGADYLGFNFFPKSPRYVTHASAAALISAVPDHVQNVGLVVNPDDEALEVLLATVPLDILQLHGSETPERVAEIKARFGLPVMKALGIGGPEDLDSIETMSAVADYLLVDTKPPKGADRPGGNAVSFDWSLIAGRSWSVPWLLAGGLTADNVSQAIRDTGATQVDVSSGVESAPGIKDAAKVDAFIKAARLA
jgi:phosphoribosylanthranilate isomerase